MARKQLHLRSDDTLRTQPGTDSRALELSVRGGPTNLRHEWEQDPAFAHRFDLQQGPLTVTLRVSAHSQHPRHSPQARVTVLNGATELGFDTQVVDHTGSYTFTITNPDVTVAPGTRLVVRVENVGQQSTSFTIRYAGPGSDDAQLDMPTTSYVSVDQVRLASPCRPGGSQRFNPAQVLTTTARVSDPFGAYDVAAAHIEIAGPDGTPTLRSTMTPLVSATRSVTYQHATTIPSDTTPGLYTAIVTATESNGVTDRGSSTFVVQEPAALAGHLSVTPGSARVGDSVTVTMVVTNTGEAAASTVVPSLIKQGTGGAVLVSGPTPPSGNLFGSDAIAFAWVYTITDLGEVFWVGSADGVDANACHRISAPPVTSNRVSVVSGPNTIHFGSPTYSVSEDAGTVSIIVSLDAAAATTVTVDCATSDGTAEAGSDYSSVNNTLSFAPGVTDWVFTVPITDDVVDEPNESVMLTLSGATHASITGTNPATITIIDDEAVSPAVQFSSGGYTFAEDTGHAIVTATLDGASPLTVSVDCATDDGTAVAGSDYAATANTLVFAPGTTSQSCTIPVIDDDAREADETIELSLSNPSQAGLGTPSTAWVTIVDDDSSAPTQVAINKRVWPSTADAPGRETTYVYTITVRNGSTGTLQIEEIEDTLPVGFSYLTTTLALGNPYTATWDGQTAAWSYGPPFPSVSSGGTVTMSFLATASVGSGTYCNDVVVSSVDGTTFAREDLACVWVPWPVYEIISQAGSQRIKARVEMKDGQLELISWEFLP